MIALYLFIFLVLVLVIGALEIATLLDSDLLDEVFETGESHPIAAWALIPVGVYLVLFAAVEGYREEIPGFWNSWLKSSGFSK